MPHLICIAFFAAALLIALAAVVWTVARERSHISEALRRTYDDHRPGGGSRGPR